MIDTKPMLSKIQEAPQTLREIVQKRLQEAILSGHFAPGDRLVERPLCDQLGVSRTVIRETIRYLEAEGLVQSIPNKGPIVATLNWEQAQQIYDIRKQLEGSAAAACALTHNDTFRTKINHALKMIETTKSDTEWAAIMDATTHFYELIFLEAGHEIAWDIVKRLNGRISRLRALTISARNRDGSGLNRIKAIHDQILTKNPAEARLAVEIHIAEASETAERHFSKMPNSTKT